MKTNIRYIVKLLTSLFITLFVFESCDFKSSDYGSGNIQNNVNTESVNSDRSSCACNTRDVRRLANEFTNEFDRIQNELPSEMARIIRIESVEESNCTWVVTFKVSWPFGNTDGAHPDEFIKKRYACDGSRVYEQ